VCIGNRLG